MRMNPIGKLYFLIIMVWSYSGFIYFLYTNKDRTSELPWYIGVPLVILFATLPIMMYITFKVAFKQEHQDREK